MTKNNLKYISIGILGIILVGVIFYFIASNRAQDNSGKIVAEVYYSPTCGCCINYMGYLRSNGFNVKAIKVEDTNKIKQETGIPKNMWSCHTTKIEGYFVEGHIPVEAIKKLLEEKPDINGIALPNMPSGSPGMPGPKKAPFDIKAVKDGKVIDAFTKI